MGPMSFNRAIFIRNYFSVICFVKESSIGLLSQRSTHGWLGLFYLFYGRWPLIHIFYPIYYLVHESFDWSTTMTRELRQIINQRCGCEWSCPVLGHHGDNIRFLGRLLCLSSFPLAASRLMNQRKEKKKDTRRPDKRIECLIPCPVHGHMTNRKNQQEVPWQIN
jgi:hypothetical protein